MTFVKDVGDGQSTTSDSYLERLRAEVRILTRGDLKSEHSHGGRGERLQDLVGVQTWHWRKPQGHSVAGWLLSCNPWPTRRGGLLGEETSCR
jgi:hypothetical protein